MTKTLKISEGTHTQMKIYCAKNHCLMSKWIDELIKLNLKYPIIVEFLKQCQDITHLYEKKNDCQNTDEIKKLEKQIELLTKQMEIYRDKYFTYPQ